MLIDHTINIGASVMKDLEKAGESILSFTTVEFSDSANAPHDVAHQRPCARRMQPDRRPAENSEESVRHE